MNYPEIWMVVAAGLLGIGLYSLIIAIKVMGFAVFLVLVISAGLIDGALDGIAQALVLTGIVIAVAAVAFAPALVVALAEQTGSGSLEPEDQDRVDGE